MQDFKKLKVWQKSHEFTVNLYRITKEFPEDEKFGLTNQLRRAAISIESNIAEGCGRNSAGDFKRFLNIARGSCCEVECQILIAKDLKYLDDKKADLLSNKITEISKMLVSLINKIK